LIQEIDDLDSRIQEYRNDDRPLYSLESFRDAASTLLYVLIVSTATFQEHLFYRIHRCDTQTKDDILNLVPASIFR
jgi:hypothetical protein